MKITVRNGFAPEVTLDVNIAATSTRTQTIYHVLEAWTSVTGLAWAKMPFTSNFDESTKTFFLEVTSPLDNRANAVFYWQE